MIEVQAEEHLVTIPDHFSRLVQLDFCLLVKQVIIAPPNLSTDAFAARVLAKTVCSPSAVVVSGVERHAVWKVPQCAASTLTTLPNVACVGPEATSV